MDWPNDADGDVFRRLQDDGFDFNETHKIDFFIDFDEWPLSDETRKAISELYPLCGFYEPDREDMEEGSAAGYVYLQIESMLTYEFVTRTQEEISGNLAPYGGRCEAWGVWQTSA